MFFNINKRRIKYAKGIARAQLLSFYAMQETFKDIPNESLYVKALSTRRKINEDLVNDFIAVAQKNSLDGRVRFLI